VVLRLGQPCLSSADNRVRLEDLESPSCRCRMRERGLFGAAYPPRSIFRTESLIRYGRILQRIDGDYGRGIIPMRGGEEKTAIVI
jgi:hypothetical protein